MPTVRTLAALALAAPLALTAALAAEQPPPEPADPTARAPLVCRGAQKSVGSRIRTPRRCRPAEIWRQEDEAGNRLPLGAQVTTGQNDGKAPAQPR